MWYPIKGEHSLGVEGSYAYCVDRFVTRQKDCCLCAPLIDNCQDAVITVRYWEICDQIHGDGLEGVLLLLMCDGQHGWFGPHCVWLGALAHGAPSYIGSSELSYLWPPEFSHNRHYGIGNSWVSC